jgi:hypothetical protein
MLGKWVRCPNCRESFQAPAAAVPTLEQKSTSKLAKPTPSPVPFEGDDLANSTYLQLVTETLDRRDDRAWSSTGFGLNLMYVGLIVGGVSFLAGVFYQLLTILTLDVVGPRFFGWGWVSASETARRFLLLGVVLGSIAHFVGACICALLGSPAPRTVRWMMGHLLCLAICMYQAYLLNNGPMRLPDQGWTEFGAATMYLSPLLASVLGSFLCLVCYLRNLARSRIDSPTWNYQKYLVFHMAWPVVSYLCLAATIHHARTFQRGLFRNLNPPSDQLIGWLALTIVAAIGGVISLIWTLRLLRATWGIIHLKQTANER